MKSELLMSFQLKIYSCIRMGRALVPESFSSYGSHFILFTLLFNTLFRSVIDFLPRSKHLLISWLQSPSTVILELKKIKSVAVSIFSPSTCHEVMGPDAMTLVF